MLHLGYKNKLLCDKKLPIKITTFANQHNFCNMQQNDNNFPISIDTFLLFFITIHANIYC